MFRVREGEEVGGRSSLETPPVCGSPCYWDIVTGLEPGDEGREDEQGRFLDWVSCLAAR